MSTLTTGATNSQPQNAFIWGTNEANGTHTVKFTLQNNVFEQTSGDGYGFVFDWAVWADGSTVSNNTFGTQDKMINTWLFRAMNFAEGATVTIANNTGYLADGSGAFSLVQSTTAFNVATVRFANNTITHVGSKKHFVWYDAPNYAGNLQIVIEASNTYNGRYVTQDDVYATSSISNGTPPYYGYLAVGVRLNSEGKIVSGNIQRGNLTEDAVKASLAEGAEFNSKTGEVVSKVAARIGEKTYATLAAAIADAEKGDTVTLAADLTESVTVPSGAELTLDLNGHTLTNEAGKHTVTNYGTLTVVNSATTTVADASANAAGVIDNVSHTKAALYNEEGATVTLNGGTLRRSQEAGTLSPESGNGNSYYTVVNRGNMTVNDGAIIELLHADGTSAGFSSIIDNGWFNGKPQTTEGATLTVNGGTIRGGKYVKNDSYGTMVVNGGQIVDGADSAILNWNNLTVSGGTLDPADTASNVIFAGKGAAGAENGNVQVKGGTFVTSVNQAVVGLATKETGQTTISGGTFKGNKPAAEYIVPGSGLAENADGSFGVQKAQLTFVGAAASGILSVDAAKTSQLGEKDLLALAAVNVEGYTVSVDADDLAAVNAALAKKDTQAKLTVTFTAQRDGVTADTLSTTLTVNVTDSSVTPAPDPEPTPDPVTKEWTVTFVSDASKPAESTSVKVEDGKTAARPADPELDGWKFLGWYTTLGADGTLSGAYDFSQPVTGDLTLYGGWAKDGSGENPAEPETPGTNDQKPAGNGSSSTESGEKTQTPAKLPASGDASLAAGAVGAVAAAGSALAAVGAFLHRRRG